VKVMLFCVVTTSPFQRYYKSTATDSDAKLKKNFRDEKFIENFIESFKQNFMSIRIMA